MKPLATNQRVLKWLNVCPAEETASKLEKNAYVIINVAGVLFALGTILGSLLFAVKHWSTNLEDAFLALFQVDLMFNLFYSAVVAYITRQKVTDLFKTLTEICNACNNPFPFKILTIFYFSIYKFMLI